MSYFTFALGATPTVSSYSFSLPLSPLGGNAGLLGSSLVGYIHSLDILDRPDLSDSTQLQKRIADNNCPAVCKFCNHLQHCLLYHPEIDFDFMNQFYLTKFMESKGVVKSSIDLLDGVMRTRSHGLVFIDPAVSLSTSVDINPCSFTLEVWFKTTGSEGTAEIVNLYHPNGNFTLSNVMDPLSKINSTNFFCNNYRYISPKAILILFWLSSCTLRSLQ
jgi:hypothetical protein